MSMHRRTKIVASIGPASDDEATLRAMIRAGMDVARINLSHGTIEDGLERYHRVRAAAREEGRHIGIIADLPGPKVRAANFGDGGVLLPTGGVVQLTSGNDGSTAEVIEVDYASLLTDIQVSDRLVLGDGKIVLTVTEKNPDKILASITAGGVARGAGDL